MQASCSSRGLVTMPSGPLTPAQWDGIKSAVGAIGTVGATLWGAWRWLTTYRRRMAAEKARALEAAERKARADEESLRARQLEAAEETARQMRIHLLEAYSQGRKDVMLDLTAIRTAVEGFDTWKDDHTLTDNRRFDAIEQGQQETHSTLGEIKGAIQGLSTDVRAVSRQADKTANDVEWLIRERGGKQ